MKAFAYIASIVLKIGRIPKRLTISCLYFYITYRRKKLSYFDFIKLSKPFEEPPLLSYAANRHYGINKAVKNRLHKFFLPLNVVIEHGVYFADTLAAFELKDFCRFPFVITMGEQREKFLRENGYTALSIGPYIKYADFYYSEKKLAEMKQRFGRTLLVFPSHSIEGVNSIFDENAFVNEIKKRAVDFKTVLICMYWKDILDGRYQRYLSQGFRVVTAGHRSDSSFLSRLKDLIYLADMTMSNNLGTHVGYCISENKPHYLYSQECTYDGELVEQENQYGNLDVYGQRLLQFKKTFGIFSYDITSEQLELVRYYWGYWKSVPK